MSASLSRRARMTRVVGAISSNIASTKARRTKIIQDADAWKITQGKNRYKGNVFFKAANEPSNTAIPKSSAIPGDGGLRNGASRGFQP